MNAIRMLFSSLLMLTIVWANPTRSQVGSTLAGSTPAAGANTPVKNSDASVSSDWARKDVRVPNVARLWRDEAILDLFKAGLRIGDVREETSTSVADHHVISESPAAGTEAKAGSRVDLVIARVPEVKVPDVVGLTLSAAKAVLDEVDLKIGRIEERNSTTVVAGLIISQHPRAGTTVREDRRVRFVVSKGRPRDTVPNVVGATQAAATTAITGAGLIVGTVRSQSSATVAAGLVIAESPPASSIVTSGSAVNLVVSTGVAKVTVPNVVGLTQAAAATAITGTGLEVGGITMQSSVTIAVGLVISESPSAGSSVAPNSSVNLVVSAGVAKVAVPNVVGQTQSAATTAITAAGLKVGAVTPQSSPTVAVGLVISENPAAGTSVAQGSTISLIVSTGVSQVLVPNVIGLTQAVATTAITASGLKLGTVTTQSSTTVAVGLVTNESPTAGTGVPSGSAVALVVSSGPPAAGAPTAVIDAVAAVIAYSTVLLDGTSSGDPTAAIQSYAWTQLTGPIVPLVGANAPQASFIAPQVSAPTPLTFRLTIKDSTGATSTASATITVNPAATSQLAVTLVSARILEAVPTNPHSDFVRADGPPLAGSSATMAVDLTGAVQAPVFTLVDVNGNVLSSPTLTMAGTSSVQPLTFFGPINVPTVPFRVAASGKTADGQVFAVRSTILVVPMNMKVSFSPSVLWLAAGAAGNSQLTIYNGGQTATFTVQFTDPQGLLSSKQGISVVIGASSSATVPIPVTYPATTGVIGPAVTATASVNGDPTRIGTATLTVWRNGTK